MYAETLATGHRAIWSLPEHLRTPNLVLIFHDAGSTPETVAEHYFTHLPPGTTGLALQAGFNAAFGHNWFNSNQHQNPNFPEVLSAAHRVLDAIDDDEYGTTSYTSIQALGIGQGAALATTLLRVRPEALDGVVGLNGYVIDNPMLSTLDAPAEDATSKRVLWITFGEEPDHPSAEFAKQWLTSHTQLVEAKTTSAITPFLTQNVS